MPLLAFDTSRLQAVVALEVEAGRRYVSLPDPGLRHGRLLIPTIRDLLGEAGLGVRDLRGIGVGLGPGSFTGLRIGVTAAQTLAWSLGIPIVGLDSLEPYARLAPAGTRVICVVAEAQRQDLYAARYERDGAGLRAVGPTEIVGREALLEELGAGTLLMGPALDRAGVSWPPGLEVAGAEMNWIDPGILLEMAREAFAAGRAVDPRALEPRYLRRSAAEDKWERLGLTTTASKNEPTRS